VIKDNGAIVLFAQVPFSIVLGASNLEMLRYNLIWEKTMAVGHLNAKKAPLKAHEEILVFYKHLPTYNPQMTKGEPYRKVAGIDNSTNYGKQDRVGRVTESDERYPRSVLKFANPNNGLDAWHPTRKAVPLLEYLLKTYTNEGDLVLDSCAGSMSTVHACLLTNRKYLAFEKDEAYFVRGCERIERVKKEISECTTSETE